MDFATARRKMVDNQVRPNDVTELRLIAVMLEVPRERFVPADRAPIAYADVDLVIDGAAPGGHKRCLLKPMTLARLIQAADVKATDRVLDVACGTGYSSAVLARLARSVIALEESSALAASAESALKSAETANVTVVNGPLDAGWPDGAPYDVVLVNGAVEIIPEKLFAQLAEGGRLVTIVGGRTLGKAMLYRRASSDVSGRPIFDATAPVLARFMKPEAFVF